MRETSFDDNFDVEPGLIFVRFREEALMSIRARLLAVALILAVATSVLAKDKKEKKSILSVSIVNAHTAAVMIVPEAREPITRPTANVDARVAVEQALDKWGRIRPTLDYQFADIVIAVRKGTKGIAPTINGPGIDTGPVIYPGGSGGGVTIGSGRRPQYPGDTGSNRPTFGTSAGTSDDDVMEIYMGHSDDPLNGPLLWRFQGKNGLNAPKVAAVEALKKAIDESLQQQQQQQSKSQTATKP
jgi:hypothetical protein